MTQHKLQQNLYNVYGKKIQSQVCKLETYKTIKINFNYESYLDQVSTRAEQ